MHRAVLLQRGVGLVPLEQEHRGVGFGPVLPRQRRRRLYRLGMNLVKIRVQRIHQRDVEAVLPGALRSVSFHAVVVPGAVGGEHEIARAKRHALAVHHCVGALAIHDEAQGGGLVAVRGGGLARVHDLDPGIEQAGGGAPFLAPRVDQHDHPACGFLGRDQRRRLLHRRRHVTPFPVHGHRLGLGKPGLDLVGDVPQRPQVPRLEIPVIGLEFRGVLDVGPANDVLALHGAPRSRPSAKCNAKRSPNGIC